LADIFLFICLAICTSCLKKQKKKSEEHFSLMEPECCKKGNETEKRQGLRFADE